MMRGVGRVVMVRGSVLRGRGLPRAVHVWRGVRGDKLRPGQVSLLVSKTERGLGVERKRWLSETTEKKEAGEQKEEATTTELAPLTTAEKVKVGMNLTGLAALLGLAGVCGYFIVVELFPNRLSPNSIFDRALDEVRKDERVIRLVGEPVKGYGRDHGGHREGRRNFIENTSYKHGESKRVRVRFNLAGPHANAFVFAEVANTSPQWVYLMVQDKRTGKVVVLHDNRVALDNSNLRSDSERAALSNLLSGPSSSSK